MMGPNFDANSWHGSHHVRLRKTKIVWSCSAWHKHTFCIYRTLVVHQSTGWTIVWDSEKLHWGIDHVVLKTFKHEILRFWEHLRTMHMCWLGWYSYKLIHILIKITDVHLHNQILFSGRQWPFCNDNSWAFPLNCLAFNWHCTRRFGGEIMWRSIASEDGAGDRVDRYQ